MPPTLKEQQTMQISNSWPVEALGIRTGGYSLRRRCLTCACSVCTYFPRGRYVLMARLRPVKITWPRACPSAFKFAMPVTVAAYEMLEANILKSRLSLPVETGFPKLAGTTHPLTLYPLTPEKFLKPQALDDALPCRACQRPHHAEHTDTGHERCRCSDQAPRLSRTCL